jgi:hypothetical protein
MVIRALSNVNSQKSAISQELLRTATFQWFCNPRKGRATHA